MDIRILESPPYGDLATLLQDAFAERKYRGLNFACADFSAEDVRNNLSNNAIVIGAFDDNESLIGMLVLNRISIKYNIRYATHEYLAVSSTAKRKGVGSALFKKLKKVAKQENIDLVLSDTAKEADSSVKYHLKNGFIIFGESHYHGRTYDSLNFVLPVSSLGKILCLRPFRFLLRKKLTIKQ